VIKPSCEVSRSKEQQASRYWVQPAARSSKKIAAAADVFAVQVLCRLLLLATLFARVPSPLNWHSCTANAAALHHICCVVAAMFTR
jgi:hypothetical protein